MWKFSDGSELDEALAVVSMGETAMRAQVAIYPGCTSPIQPAPGRVTILAEHKMGDPVPAAEIDGVTWLLLEIASETGAEATELPRKPKEDRMSRKVPSRALI